MADISSARKKWINAGFAFWAGTVIAAETALYGFGLVGGIALSLIAGGLTLLNLGGLGAIYYYNYHERTSDLQQDWSVGTTFGLAALLLLGAEALALARIGFMPEAFILVGLAVSVASLVSFVGLMAWNAYTKTYFMDIEACESSQGQGSAPKFTLRSKEIELFNNKRRAWGVISRDYQAAADASTNKQEPIVLQVSNPHPNRKLVRLRRFLGEVVLPTSKQDVHYRTSEADDAVVFSFRRELISDRTYYEIEHVSGDKATAITHLKYLLENKSLLAKISGIKISLLDGGKPAKALVDYLDKQGFSNEVTEPTEDIVFFNNTNIHPTLVQMQRESPPPRVAGPGWESSSSGGSEEDMAATLSEGALSADHIVNILFSLNQAELDKLQAQAKQRDKNPAEMIAEKRALLQKAKEQFKQLPHNSTDAERELRAIRIAHASLLHPDKNAGKSAEQFRAAERAVEIARLAISKGKSWKQICRLTLTGKGKEEQEPEEPQWDGEGLSPDERAERARLQKYHDDRPFIMPIRDKIIEACMSAIEVKSRSEEEAVMVIDYNNDAIVALIHAQKGRYDQAKEMLAKARTQEAQAREAYQSALARPEKIKNDIARLKKELEEVVRARQITSDNILLKFSEQDLLTMGDCLAGCENSIHEIEYTYRRLAEFDPFNQVPAILAQAAAGAAIADIPNEPPPPYMATVLTAAAEAGAVITLPPVNPDADPGPQAAATGSSLPRPGPSSET